MIKVGQVYDCSGKKLTIKAKDNGYFVIDDSEEIFHSTEIRLLNSIKNGTIKLIEDVPSVEEQLKDLGYTIERVTSKTNDIDNITFQRQGDVSTIVWVRYDFLNKKIYYGCRCFIGKDTTPGLSFEENKLILQYIEENENGN